MRYWRGLPMHSRRFTTLLLGLWLGASLFMDWASIDSFWTIDGAAQSAREREPILVRTIGAGPVRELLRFQTAELNRHYAYIWGYAQVALGAVLLVVVLFATNGNKAALALSAAMLLLVAGMQFAVMPPMLEQGRALDFAAGKDLTRERAAFAGSHNTYIGMEVLKLVMGFGLAGVLLYRERGGSGSTRRRRRVSDLDEVNYANHGRVNR